LVFPSGAPGFATASSSCGKLVFVSNRSQGSHELFVAQSVASAQATQITSDRTLDIQPVWSPDGTRIAYGKGTNGNFEIVVTDSNGLNAINITRDFLTTHNQPAWSPDGSRIAYISNQTADRTYDVFVSDSNGTNRNTINITNDSAIDSAPVWSPDGTRIAFVSNRTGFNDILISDSNATNRNTVNITNDRANDSAAIWSPDGTQIAYVSDRTGNSEVFVSNINGTTAVNLTNNLGLDYQPAWSPDGTRIVYTSNRTGDSDLFITEVSRSAAMADFASQAAVGSGTVNITKFGGSDDSFPAWSPDGSQIAFVSNRTGNNDIFVTPSAEALSGQAVDFAPESASASADPTINVSNNPADDSVPKWGPCVTTLTTSSSTTTTTSSTTSTIATSATTTSSPGAGNPTTTSTSIAPIAPMPPVIVTTTTAKPSVLVFLPISTATTTTTATPTTIGTPTTMPPTTTAAPLPPTFEVNPKTIADGGTITLTGSGFQPGTEASFELHSNITSLGKTTVNANGTFTYQTPTPPGTEPGNHEVFVTGTNQQGKPATLSAPLTILGPTPTAAPAPPTPAPSVLGTEEVAYTGNSTTTGPLTAGAIAIILLGTLLIIQNRRRRHKN
jgi:Tol biopolymer transport system component